VVADAVAQPDRLWARAPFRRRGRVYDRRGNLQEEDFQDPRSDGHEKLRRFRSFGVAGVHDQTEPGERRRAMSVRTLDPSAESAVRINPFPGLRPFEFDESHLFFGRNGQSEQLIAKLTGTRFLAVVGTSGSGKSSLVRAGLLPALYSGFMPSAGSG